MVSSDAVVFIILTPIVLTAVVVAFCVCYKKAFPTEVRRVKPVGSGGEAYEYPG